MKPDIFMDDFERTMCGNAHYSAIGRALTIATRFESLCKVLNTMLGVKEDRNVLESEEDVQRFVTRFYNQRLAKHITSIAAGEDQFRTLLDKARLARNEIAHDITLGLDRMIDNDPELIERLRILIDDLAKADRTLSFILSILTNEHLPVPEFLEKYPMLVQEWVTNIEDDI